MTPTIAVFTKNRTNPAYEAARLGADRTAARLGGRTMHYVPEKPDDVEEQIGLIGRRSGAGQNKNGSESESQFAHGNLQRCPRQLVIRSAAFNQAQSRSPSRPLYISATNSP